MATADALSAVPTRDRPEPARLRLGFLDGLRGLAALYVVIYHVGYYQEKIGSTLPGPLAAATAWMHFGKYAVAVFIVLSGYCLMLPVARSADGRLAGGAAAYIRRRARRILPPYYAALLLSILVVWVGTSMRHVIAAKASEGRDTLTIGPIASHLLLVHNVRLDWIWAINSPLWSVATEWQLYFLLPFVLLPLWRRFGSPAALVAGFAIGFAPIALLPPDRNLAWAYPWFAGLFSLGMLGAIVGFHPTGWEANWRQRAPWGAMAAGFAVLVVAATLWLPGWQEDYGWRIDVPVGLATMCLIVACARAAVESPDSRSPIVRILESRPAMALGHISYSLYLTHYIVQQVIIRVLQAAHLSATAIFLAHLLVGLPVILGCAYLFYRVFERPFVSSPIRRVAAARGRS